MDKTILIATTNQGKAVEIAQIIESVLPQTVFLSLSDLHTQGKIIPTAPEDAGTFETIASAKAKFYGARANMTTIAEDSGLVIHALDGRPGIYSARYGNNDPERIHNVIENMSAIAQKHRGAQFVCAVAYYHHPSGSTIVFNGKVNGRITLKPVGSKGFGYDPIFYYPPLKKTFAQLSASQKNTISHRGIAFNKLIRHLKTQASRSSSAN